MLLIFKQAITHKSLLAFWGVAKIWDLAMVERHLMLKCLVGPNRNASFPDTPFCMTIYGHMWNSPVLVYPCNSLCTHVGEMHWKANNGVLQLMETKKSVHSELLLKYYTERPGQTHSSTIICDQHVLRR